MNIREKLNSIKAFAFDVDGIFSTNKVLLASNGELLRTMHVQDGFILNYAIKKGYPVAIISGGKSDAVRIRFETLGVKHIYMQSHNKVADFNEFIAQYNLIYSDVLYMGDDMPDLDLLRKVGFAACPADAAPEIKEVCHYVTLRNGGDGCVREVMEQVLKIQDKWMDPSLMHW